MKTQEKKPRLPLSTSLAVVSGLVFFTLPASVSAYSGYAGPCDVAGGCAAAYSTTRLMTTTWTTGSLFQVVRDSPYPSSVDVSVTRTAPYVANWEGLFGPGGFCSTPSDASAPVHCYISKVYDQSGNNNHLYAFVGREHYNYSLDCATEPGACRPPLYISARYNLPVLFTPWPAGLSSCADGTSCGAQTNLPISGAAKAVFVYLDNRQVSACCGTNGLMEPVPPPGDYTYSDWNSMTQGVMFAPIVNFGTVGNFPCGSSNQYCASVDLEGTAGVSPWASPNYGVNAGDILVEAKYSSTASPELEVMVNAQLQQSGAPAVTLLNSGPQVRAGLAGDTTPIQEAVYEFMILAMSPNSSIDTEIDSNVTDFYTRAAAAASGTNSRGPADLAFLNSNAQGISQAGGWFSYPDDGGAPPAANALYSRMFGGWGLRQLNASYSGPLVQLTRSSDQATAYFGAASSGHGLDPAAQSWCSNSTCWVSELFCQAFVTPAQGGAWAAAHDAANCPPLKAPQGVSPPTLEFNSASTLNGLPTMHFNGSQHLCHNVANDMQSYWSAAAVVRQTNSTAAHQAVLAMSGGLVELGFAKPATVFWEVPTSSASGLAVGSATSGAWHSLIALANPNQIGLYVDGIMAATSSSSPVSGGSTLCIGAQDENGDNPFTGDVAEVTLSYDMTGATGAGLDPSPSAYSDPNIGNVLFNNQELAWGTLPNPPTNGTQEALAQPGMFSGPTPNGETDIVVMGPGNTLVFYWSPIGGPMQPPQTIGGPLLTFSSPSVVVRSNNGPTNGEVDVVAMGPNNSLMYYWNSYAPNSSSFASSWHSTQIAGPLTTYSAPSLFVRPTGEADIAAQGPDNTLVYYYAMPGANWASIQVAANLGPLVTYSAPSLFVRASGEVDIAAQGASNSLMYFWNMLPSSSLSFASSWNSVPVAGSLTTYSAPSLFVRSSGEADIAAQGPSNSLMYYYAMPGTQWTTLPSVGAAYSAPSLVVRSDNDYVGIAVQGASNSLMYFWNTVTPSSSLHPPFASSWTSTPVASSVSTYSAPSLVIRAPTGDPPNEANILVVGPNNSLWYYFSSSYGSWNPVPYLTASQTAY